MRKRVGIKEIAEYTNLSMTTVSVALNNPKNFPIKQSTIEKVKDAAEKLNYRASFAGRALSQGKTSLIGIIIPDLNSYFFPHIQSIEKYVKSFDYNILVASSNYNVKDQEKNIDIFKEKCDGIICIPLNREVDNKFFEKLAMPRNAYVLIENTGQNPDHDSVYGNYEEGLYTAAEYLFKNGRKKIILVTIDKESIQKPYFYSYFNQLEGFKKSAKKHNIDFEKNIVYCGYTREDAFHEVLNLLAKEDKPDAIITADDNLAFGAMEAVEKSGFIIPKDIAIIGYNNLEWCGYSKPKLSSVSISGNQIGEKAAEILVNKLKNEHISEEPIKEIIAHKLIVRESC